jgi:hypothetical protein
MPGPDSVPPDDPTTSFSYLSERDQALDQDRCFLCGVELDTVERTDEHIFPQWLLNDFDLFNEELNLPNETTIKYGSLKIPCCATCNNKWLSQIESDVSQAFRSGPDAVRDLDVGTLSLWMGKIYYGLLFKDSSLLLDRADPEKGPILDSEALRYLAELHHVLQVARRGVALHEDQLSSSIFVFNLQDPEEPLFRFDYRDTLAFPFLALRAGNVGVAACLLDWDSVRGMKFDLLSENSERTLHPTQFWELAAFCAHWRARLNRIPKYISMGGDGGPDQLITLPLGGMSSKPIFDEFDPRLFAELLAAFTCTPIELVWNPADEQIWTSLHDEKRAPLMVDVNEIPLIVPPGFVPPGA